LISRGFVGSVPAPLIKTVLRVADVGSWREVYVACSGTFRTERMVLSSFPDAIVRSNDVSLFSVGIGRWLTGEPHDFRFTGQLGWIEDLELVEPVHRLAAIVVVMNIAGFSTGKDNAYKQVHREHFRARFPSYVRAQAERLSSLQASAKIASFFAGDWLEHVDRAIEAGAGVLAYPPTYRGGYERLFKFLNENTEWQAPTYNLWDPADIGQVVEKLAASDSPYFVYSDRKIDGLAPTIELDANGRHTVYGYARSERSAFLEKAEGAGEPFAYEVVDPARLTEKTIVSIVPTTGKRMTFLKNVYLKHSIRHTAGRCNLLVYVDGMPAGGIVYKRHDFAVERDGPTAFVLSDFSTTRDGRIAKLIARISTAKEAIRHFERMQMQRFSTVRTAVFTDHHSSMKYRGVFELISRKETNAPTGRYVLTYRSAIRDETAQDAYKWWWGKGRGKPG
jgi:ketosteroid isomerase-like protein